MPQSLIAKLLVAAGFILGIAQPTFADSTALTITPAEITFAGPAKRQQFIVSGPVNGRVADLTQKASFSIAAPEIAKVDSAGVVIPVGDGTTTLTATVGSQTGTATIKVTGSKVVRVPTFEFDIQPILTRGACNSGPCHGKQRGQNGFQLSLLGFDDDFDYAALALEARGRRVFPAAPAESLLLKKPAGTMPHGGGKVLTTDSEGHEVVCRWISAGMPRTPKEAPKLQKVTVDPPGRILAPEAPQQMIVTAWYSDGSRMDVTHLSAFQSNESAIVSVDEHGLAKAGPIPGEAALMARYMNHIDVVNFAIPQPGAISADIYAKLPRKNFIDGFVWDKLKQQGIEPSEPAGDATFHRRAYLHVIGRLPTPEETKAFLADKSADKRAKLVDRLLDRPEYADYWANKWADLLRPNPYRVGMKAVRSLDIWIRDSFRQNKPYDQFVREIVAGQGSTFRAGPATIYRDRRSPDEITTMVSQLFLGIRLECAKCHHHPFEVWGQEDFYGFASYFARMGRKGQGVSPPISGGEETIFTAASGTVTHPRTGEVLPPKPLFGNPPALSPDRDPREDLAEWMTSPENRFFAQVIVNRVWADLMGRGIVEPVDDLRATNPPTNGPLLDALAVEFRKQGCDLKKLIRTIMTSAVYELSSRPNERNVADTYNYSRRYRQRLRAEVLLDAVVDITQMGEKFAAMPPDSRAVELWTHRSSSLFLDTFGRPDPNQDPPCERTSDTSVTQALHLMNSSHLHRKVISDEGRIAKLAASKQTPEEIVEELYLLVYCRYPTPEERSVGADLFKTSSRRHAAEDLLWALLNTPEFVFND